jgi:hypothetical protein
VLRAPPLLKLALQLSGPLLRLASLLLLHLHLRSKVLALLPAVLQRLAGAAQLRGQLIQLIHQLLLAAQEAEKASVGKWSRVQGCLAVES